VNESEDRLIRVPDAAERIGCGIRIVWELLSEGALTRYKIPDRRITVLSLHEVNKYIERLKGG
jgi:predicted DNA-binding transcriptional regulator AlpA